MDLTFGGRLSPCCGQSGTMPIFYAATKNWAKNVDSISRSAYQEAINIVTLKSYLHYRWDPSNGGMPRSSLGSYHHPF